MHTQPLSDILLLANLSDWGKELELVANHNFNYDIELRPSTEEVARALLAQAEIAQRLGPVLETLFEGVSIKEVKTEVQSIERGSVLEWFLVYIAVHYHGKLAKGIRKKGKKSGIKFLAKKDNSKLISAIIMALFIYGSQSAIELVKNEDFIIPEKKEVLATICEETGAEPEEVDKALRKASRDKKKIAIEASQIADFAKKDRNATIRSDTAGVKIGPATIKKIPYSLLVDQHKEERIEKGAQLNLDIHATDIDNATRGWAGVAPDISSKHVRFVISPTINLEELAKHRFIVAQTDLKYEKDKQGVEQLREVHVLNIMLLG